MVRLFLLALLVACAVPTAAQVPPPVTAPWKVEDFTTPLNITQLPKGTSAVVDTGTVNGRRVVRYDIPARGGCSNYGSPTRTMPLGQAEVWVEWSMQFAANFRPKSPTCANGAYKAFLLLGNKNASRVEYTNGHYASMQPSFAWTGTPGPNADQGPNVFTGCGSCFDGQWHTYRVHARTGPNGVAEFWVDGKLRFTSSAYVKGTSGAPSLFSAISFGATINSGPAAATWVRFSEAAVWTTDPHWP